MLNLFVLTKGFNSKDKANNIWDVLRALLLRREKCVTVTAWRSDDGGTGGVGTLEARDNDERKIRNGNKYLIWFVGCKFVAEVLPFHNYISTKWVDMNWRLSALGYAVCWATNVLFFVNICVSLESCAIIIIIIVILICVIKRATVSHAMRKL